MGVTVAPPARPFITTVSLDTGGTPQRIAPSPQWLVLAAQIQNLSQEVVTVATTAAELTFATPRGQRLNPASVGGQAGGTMSIDGQGVPIDISAYFFVRATAGLTLSVQVVQ